MADGLKYLILYYMKTVLLLFITLFFTVSIYAREFIIATNMFVQPTFLSTLGFYKATRYELKKFLKMDISYPEDLSVVRLRQTDDLYTMSDDDELTGYATDSDLNIIAYNPDMDSALVYGLKDFEEKFNKPLGIDADIYGNVFVADSKQKRIAILHNNGTKLYPKNQIFVKGIPYDITHNYHKELFITLYDKNRIIKIKQNQIINQFTNYRIKKPTGIKLIDKADRWNFFKADFIVFINNNSELIKMTQEGEIVGSTDLKKYFGKQIELKYLTIDYYANILVTDTLNNCIHKFDKDLIYIASFKGLKDEIKLYQPRGIDIWKRFGQLFLTEKQGGRYYWIGIDILKFNVYIKGGIVNIHHYCTDPFYLTIELYSEEGKLVKQVVKKAFIKSFKGRLEFKTLNKKGEWIKHGNYILKCKVEPTYSSLSRFHKVITKKIRL